MVHFADYATIGGGYANQIGLGNGNYESDSTISGGAYNVIDSHSFESTISGGRNNYISGNTETIGGGESNTNQSRFTTIAGGGNNLISTGSDNSTIGGGGNNMIASGLATIAAACAMSPPTAAARSAAAPTTKRLGLRHRPLPLSHLPGPVYLLRRRNQCPGAPRQHFCVE